MNNRDKQAMMFKKVNTFWIGTYRSEIIPHTNGNTRNVEDAIEKIVPMDAKLKPFSCNQIDMKGNTEPPTQN
jgi:hypothetical protein